MFCGLHYDPASIMSVVGPLINGEREGIRKEVLVVRPMCYVGICMNATEENHRKISQDTGYPGRDSCRTLPKCRFRTIEHGVTNQCGLQTVSKYYGHFEHA